MCYSFFRNKIFDVSLQNEDNHFQGQVRDNVA